ncbi:MAG: glutathione S-transferase family protein [Gammaproteobacteria bacterium]|nr:MAG: glutathione S-transferase family protein [Gammaproteobacteria bacterium]
MDTTIYYTHNTRALRPRWLLEEMQLPYQLHLIDLFGGEANGPEYLRINPHGTVPAAEIDGQVMLESGAICQWLTDRFPDKGFAPAHSSKERMQYEQWMYFTLGTLELPVWLTFLHTAILPEAQRVPDIVGWAAERNTPMLEILNTKLEGKDYLLGTQFTTADIMVGSTLLWQEESVQKYPALQAYTERLKSRAAYQRAITDPSPNA